LEDAKLYGIELPEETAQPVDFEVWQEHHQALLMFLRCQTQWRWGPNGMVGLDYRVVFDLFALYNVEDRQLVMEEVQIMEARALELFNDQMAKQAKSKRRHR
jgi:hypothetical protein